MCYEFPSKYTYIIRNEIDIFILHLLLVRKYQLYKHKYNNNKGLNK